MAKIKLYILTVLIILAFASFSVAAQEEDEPYTYYNENFIEGKNLTIDMNIRDKIIFTYYSKNYTFSVMGIGEQTSTVRVEKRAFEIVIGGRIFFDFDDESDEDIAVSFVDSDGDEGTYKLELFKKVWDVPEPEPEEEEPEEDEPELEEEEEEQEEPEPEEDEEEAEADEEPEPEPEADEDEKEDKKSPAGETNVNITLNFTLSEGSLMGLFIIVMIVAVGLIAYKKIRKKSYSDYEPVSRKKRKR